MNKKPLNDLKGSKVSNNIFQGFIVKETLIEYDGPLLLVARSPKGKNWLFKWCDTIEPSEVERWIAFWVSESRLEALKNNKISLREAVTLPEKKILVLEAKNLFEPISVKALPPENLPKDYLPSDDISVSGTPLRLEMKKGEHLTVRLHVFSEHISEGRVPLSIISPLQNTFQQYMTWTAHAIDRSPKGRVPASFKDWSGFNLTSVSDGSFKMECVSSSNSKQTEILAKACELLADLSNGTFDIGSLEKEFGEEFGEEFGNEIVHYASLLAEFVSKFDLSMSISWASSGDPTGYLALDKRRVDNFLNIMSLLRKDKVLRKITITLTPTEAEPIRKPIVGVGGMQSLLRRLQSKLTVENTIELSLDEIEKILRYGLNYGQGGFQDRLVGLARALKRVGSSFYTA